MDKVNKSRILIIEDELHIAEGLKLNLIKEGFEAGVINTGPKAVAEWEAWNPDLIVLDIMLPGLDGFSVLNNIRLKNERLPVLILTAKSEITDKITGLTCGVDDYMTKPFNLEEFLLRIKRLLARAVWSFGDTSEPLSFSQKTYTFGTNQIDFENSTAKTKDCLISLTEMEINILKLFIRNKGKVLSRKVLLESCWGYSGITDTRTVDNFIVRFRKYFEANPKKPVYFQSQRSVGYIFNH